MKLDEAEQGVVATSGEEELVFPVKRSLRADFLAAAAVFMRAIQLDGLRPRRLNLKKGMVLEVGRVVVVGWRWFEGGKAGVRRPVYIAALDIQAQ
jgi:hypothetical protein